MHVSIDATLVSLPKPPWFGPFYFRPHLKAGEP